jgi:hypothetical protein
MSDLIDRQAAIDAINVKNVNKGIISALQSIIEELSSAQPEWIPCSERLPKQGQEVICQCRANIIKVLKLDANSDWYQDAEHSYMSGFVIAWMPLPEPYNKADIRREKK